MDRRALLLGAGSLLGLAATATVTETAQAAPDSPAGPLGIVNVADHGAKGARGGDDTAAINAAIAAVAARDVSGDATGIVWFPAGLYSSAAPLLVPRNIKLVGESMEASKLVYTGPKGTAPFLTFGTPGTINTNSGVIGMQVNAAAKLPWAVLMYGPQEGSRISGAHICGGTTGGVDVRSAGIEGGCNKFVIDRGTWVWTSGDGGMYGLKFDDANGPLAIRDVTVVGTERTGAPPADSAGLHFNGGIQHVTNVNVERFESHTSIDGWSNFQGDTLSAYGGVSNYIRRRRFEGADPSVRYSVANLDSSGSVGTCIKDEHAGITIQSTRAYSNRDIDSSAWNGPHMTMGTFHLWVDSSGRLRMKASAPASDTDGAVVGTQN